jgi:hypothetical protein
MVWARRCGSTALGGACRECPRIQPGCYWRAAHADTRYGEFVSLAWTSEEVPALVSLSMGHGDMCESRARLRLRDSSAIH